jgi:DNA-binding transcriptional ArsR family regulator
MVVQFPRDSAKLDLVFHALSDGTRRDILARVMAGEQASVSALADRYEMSFAAVQKHVAVLESAGLVSKRQKGRERIVRGNPRQVARVRDLLTQLEQLWKDRFSQIDALFIDEP